MTLSRFAMIIKGPGYDPEVHREEIASQLFSTTIVCVSSFDQAILVAQELVDRGIQLIELCGGFSPDQASDLQNSINSYVPIGVVRYTEEERLKLAKLFNSSSICPENA
ncbi:MAG TPA: DUF6506 family protein [Burkholderiaceae bacterium]|nr:DUF6506 family protein [Burkholderiaceae bacterium]